MLDDFAVFILTHGRADNVATYKTLRRSGYTGRVYIIIDNEDKQADKYRANFGDKVIMFDKAAEAEKTDCGDNYDGRGIVVYARNAVFDIAESLGIEYFIVLDDDYTRFDYRFDANNESIQDWVNNFDSVVSLMLNYYKNISALSLCMMQSGDFIGGVKSGEGKIIRTYRKAMNSFICSPSRRFSFMGRVNEDVNAYVSLGNRGGLFLSINNVTITQKTTQAHEGGLTDTYLNQGTYIKSFYTVMYQPSSVKVGLMGDTHKRLHHNIDWDYTVPCIISEEWRKE